MPQQLTDIPGPPLPSEGHHLAAIAAAGGMHTFQLDLHRRYGDLARFRLPHSTVVSVADPVLLEATVRINERPADLFRFLDPFFESGNLQVLPEPEYVPWRRVVLPALGDHAKHAAMFPRMAAAVEQLADRWAASGEPVALQHELNNLALRMVCSYALGDAFDSAKLAARIVDAFQFLLDHFLHEARGVEPPTPPGERRRRVEQAQWTLREAVTEVIARREAGHGRADSADLVGALVAAGWPVGRIRDTVLGTMLGGHHTSGVATSWALHLVSLHPDVERRLHAELDAVLDGRTRPEHGDLRRLRYLEMTLNESMRLYPPGPYAARESTTDIVVGDHLVPAGTTILHPIWAVHTNPRVWPEPDRFDPERFAPPAVAARHRLAFLPFGIGPRHCSGAGLAMTQTKLMLAVLAHRFRFRLVPGHVVTPVERFVLCAEDDIRMVVTPR
ncbi:cytochrome P450, family 20, subfamily A [Streptoalloteichus tenebrarius]|uniref:Cytochrome P450, family 20, subfamily A n=1 Tax=Streptoalloteichus tenebrarius (strain ATCC 17920 / DSM 40477 / JCM 4838 / CBS 697.72 / NBRC 16177 / NCIMB 11028 / NRRL B-12390 / A12253. 1 / ISP 5477) TaxID=1933 RepID=A0ABT1HUH7_STRSD|nr:cytochrome P450 [Streptoalloteichus tenebrarius]MCP2259170.1 cytochrome P450, family 20, subfamily A [Streptoalloteichus tenebrarius]BFF04353.1 cytochrome P450 [Streptoalloteichus tenebrarius]